MSLRKLTYLNKLAIYGVILGIVPLAILGLFSYIRAATTVQHYVEVGNAQILKISQIAIEQNLKTVETSLAAYLNTPSAAASFNLPLHIQNVEPFIDIQTSMRQLQVFELGVQDVTMYNLDYGWKVNNAGIAAFDPGQEKIDGYSEFLNSRKNSVWLPNREGIQYMKKNPLYIPNPSTIVVAEIPFSHLSKLLLRTNPLGSVAILDSGLQLLLEQDRGWAQEMLTAADFQEQLKAAPADEGQFTLEHNGNAYGITFVRSDYNGWIYVAAASLEQFTKESKAIGSFTLWTCALIAGLILLASWFGSRNMYRPIRLLYDTIVSHGERERSRSKGEMPQEDHLQQIGQSVAGLLDREKKMSGQIKGYDSQLKAFFVQKLLLGDVLKREIGEKLEQLEFPQRWKRLKVMAVEIDTLEGTRYGDKDADLLLFALGNMVSDIVPPTMRLTPIVISNRQWSVLGTEDEHMEAWNQELHDWAEKLQRAAETYLGITVSIGFSQPIERWTGIPAGCKQAEATLKYRVMLGNEAIIYSEDVLREPESDVQYPFRAERELVSAIKNGYRQQAEEKLVCLMQELVKPPFHFEEYQLALFRIMTEICGLLQEEGIPLKKIVRDEQPLIQQMSAMRTVEEMEEWFIHKLIHPVIAHLDEQRGSQLKKISEAVIDMIHSEFATDLTLELCASRIGYHPHYVSKVFRQETGINFSEYLLQYRLQMAKTWLTDTNLTITEIAEQLKYTNPTNFIRYFRKIEGITPGQYREKMLGMSAKNI